MNLDLDPAFTRALQTRATFLRTYDGRRVVVPNAHLFPDTVVVNTAFEHRRLRVRWWIAPPKRADALDARDKVLSAIKNQLSSRGMDLPFPTHQILFHYQTEDSDGDRARQREGWPAGHTDVSPSRKVADAMRQLSGSKPRVAE